MSLRKAVICGIDEYPAPNRLPSCVKDARAIAKVVAENYGCDAVHLVLDRDATIARVKQELGWMAADSHRRTVSSSTTPATASRLCVAT